jgi:hypothetical protein
MIRINREDAVEFTDVSIFGSGIAFAIRITDPSLAPKFDLGDVAIVDPDALAGPGDYACITLKDKRIVVGRLVERSGGLIEYRRPGISEFSQLSASEVHAVEKIVGVVLR